MGFSGTNCFWVFLRRKTEENSTEKERTHRSQQYKCGAVWLAEVREVIKPCVMTVQVSVFIVVCACVLRSLSF